MYWPLLRKAQSMKRRKASSSLNRAFPTQHYAFTANAFVELVKEFGGEEYEFTIRETKTHEIIEDVKLLRSELGIIYLSAYNEIVIRKLPYETTLPIALNPKSSLTSMST